MGLEVSQTSGNLERYVEKIKSRIKNIADDFYCIGYYLWEVKHFNYFLEHGYKDIYEFSEKELNFKKSSTKNFISLVDKYADHAPGSSYPKMWIAEKYRLFGYSQLTEMLSLSPEHVDCISSDMTIKEIREKKKELKNVEVLENKVIDVDFVPEEKVNKLNSEKKYLLNDPGQNVVEKQNFIPVIESTQKDVIQYLNDRLEVLRKLAKGEKKESIDRVKYLAGAYEVELLIDFIEKDGENLFLE